MLLEKRCKWCGRTFKSKTRRGEFCSDRCRQAHYRAKVNGTPIKLPQGKPPELIPSISEDDIAAAVVRMKGLAAFMDSAANYGPENRERLCRVLSNRILSALSEVGLR